MPFTPPNRYWPRPDWKQVLKLLGGGFPPWHAPVGSFQLDLVAYQQKRNGGMSLMKAWTQAGMTPEKARKSLMTVLPAANNLSGLIPPEIFSRVLARSRATGVNPNDDAADAIVENPPQGMVAAFTMAGAVPPAGSKATPRKAAKSAKRKTPKRKVAKSAKRKMPKRKAAKRAR